MPRLNAEEIGREFNFDVTKEALCQRCGVRMFRTQAPSHCVHCRKFLASLSLGDQFFELLRRIERRYKGLIAPDWISDTDLVFWKAAVDEIAVLEKLNGR